MAKDILFSTEARSKLQAGVSKLAHAVRITMGPKGRDVILDKKYGGPIITNDGVTIAKEIELEDRFENIGAQMVKEVSTKTNDSAGDGTTTAIVLADAMISEGMKNVTAGANPLVMKLGMERAVEIARKELDDMAKKVSTKEEIAQVGTIAAQNREVGELISEVIDTIGQDGVITIEDGQTVGYSKEVVEGMQIDNGYISPYMMTDPQRLEAVHDNALILITDKKISSLQPLVPLLEGIAGQGRKDIVIIAEDIDSEALTTIVLNKIRGSFNILGIKAPGFGDRRKEILKDIAVLTGATLISDEIGLSFDKVTPEHLGQAGKLIATKDKTVIVNGKGDKNAIEDRVETLRREEAQTSSDFDREKLAERIGKLSGGVAVIKVGAATELEQKEKKMRLEDALSATRAAIAEGVVAGGGSALTAVSRKLQAEIFKEEKNHDFALGLKVVKEACTAPIKQIAKNSGFSSDVVFSKVLDAIKENKEMGFDASRSVTDDIVVENLFAKGILDPKKVVRVALEYASSVAGTFLTMEAAITDLPEKESSMPDMSGMGGMGGMGGMM
jgi:chaperonin GroEL